MSLIRRLHPVAGGLGFAIILLFWTSTVAVELWGGRDAIIAWKQTLPWGLLLLIPALATTGATGFRLGGRSPLPLVLAKKRRMPIIAANGLLVLTPSALALAWLASQNALGVTFAVIQSVELIAGAVNLTLMALSIRDGFRITPRR